MKAPFPQRNALFNGDADDSQLLTLLLELLRRVAEQLEATRIVQQLQDGASDVVHKAYVDVHEKGTEAAAATAVGVEAVSARPPRPKAVFRADHPFFFLIRDNRTGSTLFVGRLTNPLAS